jgi:hypothetical protein
MGIDKLNVAARQPLCWGIEFPHVTLKLWIYLDVLFSYYAKYAN